MINEQVPRFPMIVGGNEVSGGDNYGRVFRPSDQQIIAQYRKAESTDVNMAIEVSQKGKNEMRDLAPWKVAKILRRTAEMIETVREELRNHLIDEGGKIWRDAESEITRTVAVFELASEECTRVEGQLHNPNSYQYPPGNETRFAYTKYEPVGVVVAITPWNYPLLGPAHKIAPALAARNALLLKPASLTPLSAIRLGQLLVTCGLPKDALSVLPGSGATVGKALVESEKTDFVTLTGDTSTGLSVAALAAGKGKRSIMELGGMDPLILLPDGNMEKAVRDATRGAFTHAGQVCIASKRMIVDEKIADKFADALSKSAESLRIGDPHSKDTDLGPMIDSGALDRVDFMIKEAVGSGATLRTGGRKAEGGSLSKGHFFLATVIDNVSEDMSLNREEPFGPIAPIIRVETVDQAIEAANNNPFGLSSSIYTSDIGAAIKIADRIQAGGVRINDPPSTRWDNLPHGGVKKSGFGREGVRY
ncbi:MAG: aldehyde dehydrogenase family protein, partial [Nitrososphaerales archaeon]